MSEIQLIFISIFSSAIFSIIGLFIAYDSSKKGMSFTKLTIFNSLLLTICFVSLFFAFPKIHESFVIDNYGFMNTAIFGYKMFNDFTYSILRYSMIYLVSLMFLIIVSTELVENDGRHVIAFAPGVFAFGATYVFSKFASVYFVLNSMILFVLFSVVIFVALMFVGAVIIISFS